jgi:V/A-type H+/Na+-transporting ATPase subunit C
MPDFPYINARVRAMHSRLLRPARLEEFLGLPALDAFIQALGNTPYGQHVQEALTRHDGVRAIDEALARNFYQATTKVLGFADGKPRELIEVVLLRWDLTNLHAILRGKHGERTGEETLANLIPAGSLSEVALRELAGQADVRGVIGALGGMDHPLATPLAEGLAHYQQTKDLLALELRLDRFYAEYGLRKASGGGHSGEVLRRLLQVQIDVTNVKTALKLQRAGQLSAEQRLTFFIPGGDAASTEGRVDERLFLALSDPATAQAAMAVLRLRGLPVRASADDLVGLERELDLAMIRAQSALYRGDPLEIDIVIAYFARKYSEVVNLRLIARSKALGIPRDRVRKEMIGA